MPSGTLFVPPLPSRRRGGIVSRSVHQLDLMREAGPALGVTVDDRDRAKDLKTGRFCTSAGLRRFIQDALGD